MKKLIAIFCMILLSVNVFAGEFPTDGQYQVFDEDNSLIMEWNFKNGKKDGIQKLFAPQGMQIASIEYNDGTIVKKNMLENIMASNFLTSAASMLQNQEKLEDAVEVYKEAINVRPENDTANYHLAELYVDLNEKDKAIEQLEAFLAHIKTTKEWKSALAESKCQTLLNKLKSE